MKNFSDTPMAHTYNHNMLKKISLVFFLITGIFSAHIYAHDHAVSYEGEQLFTLSKNLPKKPAQKRAKESSKLLVHAIEAKQTEAKVALVSADLKDDHFLLYVRGILIATIYQEDAHVKNAQLLGEYSEQVQAKLKTLVEQELTRQKWQRIALRFFISIILIIFGFFLIRQLKTAFDNLEVILVKKQDLLRKFRIFGVPFFHNTSAAGLLAFFIEVCRWLAYIASVTIIFISILSQFDLTRALLRTVGHATLMDLASSLERITTSIPGIILACLILLSLHIAIHAFNLMLNGATMQKGKLRSIPEHRIPIFKTVVPAILLAIFLPLAIASLFQRFDTPTQWLVVGTSLIVVLGALPLLATWLCGSMILWRNELKEGTWVCINGQEGEISSLNTIFLHLVPISGGTITIPMLKVFLSPIKKYATPPKEIIDIEIKNSPHLEAMLVKLEQELSEIVDGLTVTPISLKDDRVLCQISFSLSSSDTKAKIIYCIAKNSDVLKPPHKHE